MPHRVAHGFRRGTRTPVPACTGMDDLLVVVISVQVLNFVVLEVYANPVVENDTLVVYVVNTTPDEGVFRGLC